MANSVRYEGDLIEMIAQDIITKSPEGLRVADQQRSRRRRNTRIAYTCQEPVKDSTPGVYSFDGVIYLNIYVPLCVRTRYHDCGGNASDIHG